MQCKTVYSTAVAPESRVTATDRIKSHVDEKMREDAASGQVHIGSLGEYVKELRARESDEKKKNQPGLAAKFDTIIFVKKEDSALLKYNTARNNAGEIASRFGGGAKIPATFSSHPMNLAAIRADVTREHLRKALQGSPVAAEMIDGRTDLGSGKCASEYLRWVEEGVRPATTFLELCKVSGSGSESLFGSLEEMLSRWAASDKVCATGSDGASNMARPTWPRGCRSAFGTCLGYIVSPTEPHLAWAQWWTRSRNSTTLNAQSNR